MTKSQERQFELISNLSYEEIQTIVDQKQELEHQVSKAAHIYIAIRPALVGIGGLFSLLFPKIRKGLNVLVTALDLLFGVNP